MWPWSLYSDLGDQENKVCHCFHYFPIYLPQSDETGGHGLPLLNARICQLITSFSWIHTLYFLPASLVLQRPALGVLDSQSSRPYEESFEVHLRTVYLGDVAPEWSLLELACMNAEVVPKTISRCREVSGAWNVKCKAWALGKIPPRRTHRRMRRMCTEQDSAKWLEEASDRAHWNADKMRLIALPKRRTMLALTFYKSISPQPFFSHAPKWCSGQECDCQCRRREFNPWIRKIPWRRKWKPTPVFLPGEPHEQRSLVGYSFWVLHKESDMT